MEFTFTFGIVDCCFWGTVFTVAVLGAAYDAYKFVKKRFSNRIVLRRFLYLCVYVSPFAATFIFVQWLSIKLVV